MIFLVEQNLYLFIFTTSTSSEKSAPTAIQAQILTGYRQAEALLFISVSQP